MLKVPIPLIIAFPFHIKAAGKIKNLDIQPSRTVGTSSCRLVPSCHHLQAGMPTLCSLRGEPGRLHYCFLLLAPWRNRRTHFCLPSHREAQCLAHSKHSTHVCWMNGGWINSKRIWIYDLLTQKSTSIPVFQHSAFRKWSCVHQKSTNKGYTDCQSNNLMC